MSFPVNEWARSVENELRGDETGNRFRIVTAWPNEIFPSPFRLILDDIERPEPTYLEKGHGYLGVGWETSGRVCKKSPIVATALITAEIPEWPKRTKE
jgi:hypothetical protein